jgi:DNA helicase-2/ATP-dependent DNA helicase PcrA
MDDLAKLTEGLNAEQARAVRTLDGPLLILAGAGSGKTRVLTRRIAALLARGTIGPGAAAPWLRPWNILAVTFTNKAAGEMRHRVADLVGEAAKRVWVSTFHSTCVRILREDVEPLGWRRDFVIYDDDDQLRVIKAVLTELRISLKELPPAGVRGRIDRHKNGLSRDETVPRSDPFPTILERYQARLKAANAFDFNDLINKVVELWETVPPVLEKWQARWRYVLVDEYQDTNPAQYRFLRLIAGASRNIAVVGDDDQSIYRFRGADLRNILEFEQDFPGAAVIKLEQNYRSKANILRAASGVVAHNRTRKEKTLRTDAEDGEPVQLVLTDDDTAEATEVVNRMLGLGRRWGDYAIIYRTNAQSRQVEQALSRNRIPYVLVGGRKFYDRMEVKDLLAYLRVIVNPDDDVAFQRILNVPARGLGDKALEALHDDAGAHGGSLRAAARRLGGGGGRAGRALAELTILLDRLASQQAVLELPEFVERVITDSGYLSMLEAEDTDEARGRIENLRELVRSAAAVLEEGSEEEGDEPLTEVDPLRRFLDQASLAGQADELPAEGSGAVTLLTAHLAKGLEFPIVFVIGMVEKGFPHARAELEDDIEEERRLAYVAYTRARERLFVTAPRRRRGPDGWFEDAMLSRFVAEIPEAALRGGERGGMAVWRGGLGFGRGAPAAAPSRAWPAARPAPPPAPGRPAAALGRPRLPAPPAAPPARNLARPAGLRTMVPESMDSFVEGAAVLHPMLGTGTIHRRDGTPSNPRLTIHFDAHGPRTVYAVTAKLELVIPT